MSKDLSQTALNEAHAIIIRVKEADDVKHAMLWLHSIGLPVKCDPTKKYFISPSCGGAFIPVKGEYTYIAFDVHLGFYVAVTREQLDKMCAGMRLSTSVIDEDKIVDFLMLVRAMLVECVDIFGEESKELCSGMVDSMSDELLRQSIAFTNASFGGGLTDADVYVPLRVNVASKRSGVADACEKVGKKTTAAGMSSPVQHMNNDNSEFDKYAAYGKGNVAKDGFHKTVPGLAVKNALARLERAIESRQEGTSIEEVIESAPAIGLTLNQANEVVRLAKKMYGVS